MYRELFLHVRRSTPIKEAIFKISNLKLMLSILAEIM